MISEISTQAEREPLASGLVTGFLAGLAATAPMTVAMEAMHRRLPEQERWPLPPRVITARVAENIGALDNLSEHARRNLTMIAHFGYGAAMGSIYSATLHKVRAPAPIKGAAFGLAVWAGSYLGLLPAAGILKPATQHRARRNALMIASHLVWGVATGVVTRELTRAKNDDAFARSTPSAGASPSSAFAQ